MILPPGLSAAAGRRRRSHRMAEVARATAIRRWSIGWTHIDRGAPPLSPQQSRADERCRARQQARNRRDVGMDTTGIAFSGIDRALNLIPI
jgi:hypothetical protein